MTKEAVVLLHCHIIGFVFNVILFRGRYHNKTFPVIVLQVRISVKNRQNRFSYMFFGPFLFILRVSSLQRSLASVVIHAAQE